MKLSNVLFRLNRKLFTKVIPEKIYPSFYEAAARCSSGLYSNRHVTGLVQRRAGHLRHGISDLSGIHINPGLLAIVQVIQQLQRQDPGRPVHVIDYGGGDGMYYLHARKLLQPCLRLSWHIVETSAMVSAMQPYTTGELHYFSCIREASEKLKDRVHIVFTSGTLQYTPAPYEALEELLRLKSNFLIFNRQSLSLEDFDVISIQSSPLSWHGHSVGEIPEGFEEKIIRYPHTSIRKDRFEEMIGRDYDILYTFEELSGVKPVNKYRICGTSYVCALKSL